MYVNPLKINVLIEVEFFVDKLKKIVKFFKCNSKLSFIIG